MIIKQEENKRQQENINSNINQNEVKKQKNNFVIPSQKKTSNEISASNENKENNNNDHLIEIQKNYIHTKIKSPLHCQTNLYTPSRNINNELFSLALNNTKDQRTNSTPIKSKKLKNSSDSTSFSQYANQQNINNNIPPLTDSGRQMVYDEVIKPTPFNSPTNKNDKLNKVSTIDLKILPSIQDTPKFGYNQQFSQCILCLKIFQASDCIFPIGCTHIFCKSCIHKYFDERISNGDINSCEFYCPIIKCPGLFNQDIILQIVSRNYSNILLGELGDKKFIKVLNDIQRLRKDNNNEQVKFYSKKNVFDCNSNENFFMYSKSNKEHCPLCNEIYLFTKDKMDFFICLNCRSQYCKFCKGKFEPLHLNRFNTKRCKVYFRRKSLEITRIRYKGFFSSRVFIVQYLLYLIYTIAAFWIFLIGMTLNITNGIKYMLHISNKNTKSKCFDKLKLPVFMFFEVLCVIIIPLIIFLLIPYFPLFLVINI